MCLPPSKPLNGTAPALGLRAGNDVVTILWQTASEMEIDSCG